MLVHNWLLAGLLPLGRAQDMIETTWASVVVTLYGDRVPLLSPQFSVLTPLGAQNLYSAGTLFRERYIARLSESSGVNTAIQGISPYEIDNLQVFVM
jgi:hypothetical protein